MVPLPSGLLGAFEDWLRGRWLRPSWLVRRGSLALGFGLLGLRWSEVEVMERGDLEAGEGVLYVRTRKRGQPRLIEVPGDLLAGAVRLRAEVAASSERVFVRRNGTPMTYQDQRRFTAVATRAVFGRPFSFHCLRHTAAVRVYERTRDVLAVQRYLGHKSLLWTNAYLQSLRVVDVGGPVAFCGGGGPARVRVFDPDGKLGRVATVRSVASRGKASASPGDPALDGDRAAEAAAAAKVTGGPGHACVLSELMPMRHGVDETRWHCRVCGARFEKTPGGMVLDGPGYERVALEVIEEEEDERSRRCPSVHANMEVRAGEIGPEVWCRDCGKYLGRKMPERKPKPRTSAKRKGTRLDQQGQLF